VDELPPSFRAVFMLRAVEQMSITETASCLGIPGETVKTRFHRANKLLRQVLTAQFGAIFDDVYPFLGSRCDRVVATVPWTLWDNVAGSAEDGRRWRAAYLRRTYETGAYRPYELLVAEAAAETGLSPSLAAQLAARYGELKPWPEVREVLRGAWRRHRAGDRHKLLRGSCGDRRCLHRRRVRGGRNRRTRRLLQASPAAV